MEDFSYSSFKKIGDGGFGQMFEGIWHGTPVAVKIIKQSNKYKKLIITEVQNLNKIRHPNIVNIMAVAVEFSDNCYILIELVKGKTLRKILCSASGRAEYNLNEIQRNFIGLQLARAITFLHNL